MSLLILKMKRQKNRAGIEFAVEEIKLEIQQAVFLQENEKVAGMKEETVF